MRFDMKVYTSSDDYRNEKQRAANCLDLKAFGLAERLDYHGYPDLAKTVRSIRPRLRQDMHNNDRESTI